MINIVIVNWNGGSLIEECLDSLRSARTPNCSFDITVVDNASNDQSSKYLVGQIDIKLLRNAHNEGFARACNQGAFVGKSEFLLFLNPDTRIESDVFSPIIKWLKDPENADVATVGIKLIDEHGRSTGVCSRLPNFGNMILSSLGLDRLAMFRHLSSSMAHDELQQTMLVDQVIGAFYFIRRDVFETINGFDDDFFVYYEEVDLSLRLRNIGKKIAYLADVSALHLGGGTTNNAKALRTFLSLRGRLIYTIKHFSLVEKLILLPVILVVQPLIRILTALFSGRRSAWEEAKAGLLLWRWFIFHRQNRRWMP